MRAGNGLFLKTRKRERCNVSLADADSITVDAAVVAAAAGVSSDFVFHHRLGNNTESFFFSPDWNRQD